MKRPKPPRTPSYRHHKATGQAYVELNKRRIYLGRFDRPGTRGKYHRLIAEWEAGGRQLPVEPARITVSELTARFWSHAETYYVKDGEPTSELEWYRSAFRPLVELYGTEPAESFGPLKLKAVRTRMIESKHARKAINSRVGRIKHVFRWGAGNELISGSVYEAIRCVDGLRRGRSEARETAPIRPVPDEYIEAVRPFVSQQVRAMIDMQLLTAARPGELVIVRPIDLNTEGKVWEYVPTTHKCAYRGHSRTIFLGPKAQAVIRPFLDRPVESFCFSAVEAETERHAKASCHRRPDQQANDKKTDRTVGERYTRDSYRRAIHRGCDRAFPPPDGVTGEELKAWRSDHRWSPHRLRHNAATRFRREFGIDLAQTILGHRLGSAVTEIYAEANTSKARAVVAEAG